MKKLLLPALLLPIFIINLHSQTEVVIESFENWGANGLPVGYEWSYDPWPSAVVQVSGYVGSGMKLIDQYYVAGTDLNSISNCSNPYYYSAKLPDSLRFNYQSSSPSPDHQSISIRFYNGMGGLAWWCYIDAGPFTNWYPVSIPISGENNFTSIVIDVNLYRGPGVNNEWCIYDEITLVWNSSIQLIEPTGGIKWIAGEKRMIEWSALNADDTLNIEYSTDGGASFILIEDSVAASSGQYEWYIPDNLLTTKARIKITNLNDNNIAESENFSIKPYIITRLDNNGDYIAYNIDFDRWGFGNTKAEMWPVWWWLRFNYEVQTDTFTNMRFSQSQGDSVFAQADMSDFPDWYSFVKAFTVNRCYRHTGLGIYRNSALLKWKSKKRDWYGSCFGISAANALAFRKKSQFQSKYPYFPAFVDPVNVQSDSNVIPVITELFAQQIGNPTTLHRDNCWNPSPGKRVNETLQEIKAMLIQDNTPIKTLSMWNNANIKQGHTILPYLLEQDPVDEWLYYLYVWDNSHPNLTYAIINIDTTAYSNTGRWDPVYGWNGWGGDSWFILEVISDQYLNGGTIPKANDNHSPSVYWPMGVEIDATENSDIIITDSSGNRTGYADGNVLNEIPYGLPLILTNPVDTPPYGYLLGIRNYSIMLDNFQSDTIDAYFFSQNKGFSYERYGAENTETDRLFFDGGISAVNPDNKIKTVKLLSLIDDTTAAEDKMIVIKSLALEQNDSVKIIPIDDNKFSLISYGSAQEYQVVLEYASENQWEIFGNNNVQLTANTTHTFVPDWQNIYTSQLTILVDEGNDGTIDDTLHMENQVTGIGDDQGSLLSPDSYNLAQNYPNPFNPTTTIQYSIPQRSSVTLKVYDVLGNEITTLVDEYKPAGKYEVEFDASTLPSGVYLYRIKAGSFVQTRKMLLLK